MGRALYNISTTRSLPPHPSSPCSLTASFHSSDSQEPFLTQDPKPSPATVQNKLISVSAWQQNELLVCPFFYSFNKYLPSTHLFTILPWHLLQTTTPQPDTRNIMTSTHATTPTTSTTITTVLTLMELKTSRKYGHCSENHHDIHPKSINPWPPSPQYHLTSLWSTWLLALKCHQFFTKQKNKQQNTACIPNKHSVTLTPSTAQSSWTHTHLYLHACFQIHFIPNSLQLEQEEIPFCRYNVSQNLHTDTN